MIDRRSVAAMVLSASALVALVLSEGYSDNAIIPVKGDVPTIGFGTTEGVKLGDKITPPVALGRALQAAQKYEGAIRQCVFVRLSQNEYDAYTLLSYNIGAKAFCSSTLVKKLNAGGYDGACREIARWDKFKGKPLRGLTIRRQAEMKLCLGEEGGQT